MSATPQVVTATGEDILRIASTHIGEKYFLGALAPKDNPTYQGPWDCAEFASWAVYQAAAILYGCANDSGNPATADAYTGYWERDAQSLGRIVSIEQAAGIPGAFVLRRPGGAIGHIVISDGKGGTVEAHSRVDGVIRSKLADRTWHMGILPAGISYGENLPVPVAPPAVVYQLTTPYTRGDKVREIQLKLKAAGCDPGPIDGVFGEHMKAAVIGFQAQQGSMAIDGIVGPSTAAALGIQLP